MLYASVFHPPSVNYRPRLSFISKDNGKTATVPTAMCHEDRSGGELQVPLSLVLDKWLASTLATLTSVCISEPQREEFLPLTNSNHKNMFTQTGEFSLSQLNVYLLTNAW